MASVEAQYWPDRENARLRQFHLKWGAFCSNPVNCSPKTSMTRTNVQDWIAFKADYLNVFTGYWVFYYDEEIRAKAVEFIKQWATNASKSIIERDVIWNQKKGRDFLKAFDDLEKWKKTLKYKKKFQDVCKPQGTCACSHYFKKCCDQGASRRYPKEC